MTPILTLVLHVDNICRNIPVFAINTASSVYWEHHNCDFVYSVVLQSFLGCCVFLLQNKKKQQRTQKRERRKHLPATTTKLHGKRSKKKIGLNIDSVLLWFGFLFIFIFISYFSLYILLSLITR